MIIWKLIAALSVSAAIGSAATRLLCPRIGSRFDYLLLVLSIGIPSGLGLSSLLLFIWLIATHGNGKTEPVLALLLAIVLAGSVLVWRRPVEKATLPRADTAHKNPWVVSGFWLAVCVGLTNFVLLCLISPHGDWDAWGHWNRFARFMFRGGEHWREIFSATEAGWSLGYPLLLPGAVAHCWFFCRKESLLAPNAIGLLFTVAVVGQVISSLSVLRSSNQGLIAAIILLCSPQFINQGTMQYADIPLASFYLAAVLVFCLHDSLSLHPRWLVMAGMITGMAAWTKNEGILFVVAMVLVRFVSARAWRGAKSWVREFLPFALGLFPVLSVVLYFKFRMVGPVSDLLVDQTPQSILAHLVTWSRYITIFKAFGKQAIGYGGWIVPIPPLLLMYLLIVGINHKRRDKGAIYTGLLTIMVLSAGYFFIYLITPYDLAWHLDTSLDRVLMQVWPIAILTYFLSARTPEEAAESQGAEGGREFLFMRKS